MGETQKAKARREREGFFEKYVDLSRPGIDIGCQHDPLNAIFRRYDLIFGDGDCTEMADCPDAAFGTVYASHVLEHVHEPVAALQSWWRILAPGGNLIVSVPHRDLYEKKKELPSNWNFDHKWFWLPEKNEAPHTLSFKAVIEQAIPDANIVYFKVCDEGWVDVGPLNHSTGEFSIEAVVKKG